MDEKYLYVMNIKNKILNETLQFEDLDFSIIDKYEYSLQFLNIDDYLWDSFKRNVLKKTILDEFKLKSYHDELENWFDGLSYYLKRLNPNDIDSMALVLTMKGILTVCTLQRRSLKIMNKLTM